MAGLDTLVQQHQPLYTVCRSFTLVRSGSFSHCSCCRMVHLRAYGNSKGVAVKSHTLPIGKCFTCRPRAASFPSSR